MRISDWSSDVCSSDLVRLSGQDARRGTFFHRHATIHDFKNGARFTPLRHLVKDKYGFVVNDTLLSEEGVLGFEYGYSTTDPVSLVIWEAQFGDFETGRASCRERVCQYVLFSVVPGLLKK